MHTTALWIVFISSVAYIFGGMIVLFKKDWPQSRLLILTALSAGLLISISILDLIPDTHDELSNNSLYVMIGLVVMYLLHQLSKKSPKQPDSETAGAAAGVSVGMLFHNFFEGLSIGVSYEVNVHLGLLVTLALVLHKIPEGLTYSSVMLSASGDRRKTAIFLAVQAVFTWIGAGSSLLLSGDHEKIVAIALSITAGFFLYLGGTSLLPSANKASGWRIPVFFIGGVLLYAALHGISGALG